MKRILSTCLVAASAALSAQIYTAQSFEGTNLPADWESYYDDALSDTRTVYFGDDAGTACAGVQAAAVNVYGSSSNNWYLVYTAPAGVSNNTPVSFSFKYLAAAYGTNSNVAGTFDFEYSVDNGATWASALPAPIAINAATGGSIPCTQVSGVIPAAAFTGLASSIQPKFRFHASSSSGADYYQGFDDVSISQTLSCNVPSNVSAVATGVNTGTATWTAPSAAPANGYEIYYSNSAITPPATTAGNATVAAGTTTYSLTGLSQGTTYHVFVRSLCSATDKSPYIGTGTFTTACDSYNAPYLNTFDNGASVCWTFASGMTNGQPTSMNNPYWHPIGFLGTGTDDSYSMNLYDTHRVGWMISPTFNLQPTTASYKVEFDYGITEFYSDTPSAMGSDDTVQLMMSTNGGAIWTSIQTWDVNSNVPATSTHFSYILPNGTPVNNLKFAVVGNDGTVNDTEDYEFYVDNFAVNQVTNLATAEVNGKAKDPEVYPNPFNEELGITHGENVKSVEIFDAAGRLVKSLSGRTERIATSDLKSGLYFIKIVHKDGSSFSTKAIKK